MSIVVDFAWTKPTVAQLRSWGAVAAFMYVSSDPSKNASKALISEYAAAGIKSGLFFENTASRALSGYAGGVADAKAYSAQAASYGEPSWAPLIPAVDFDVPDYEPNSTDPMAKLGPVGQYLKGWCDVIGKNRVVAYGGYWLVTRAIAAGVAFCGVQTIAWSGGQVDMSHIATLQNGKMLDNGQVDVEVIESTALLNRIAWVPGEANPLAPPPKPAPAPAVSVSWSQWPSTAELHLGSIGPAVLVLQTALANSGIYGVRGIAKDGIFGNQTRTATGNFQAFEHLNEDYIAGQKTRAKLVGLNDL